METRERRMYHLETIFRVLFFSRPVTFVSLTDIRFSEISTSTLRFYAREEQRGRRVTSRCNFLPCAHGSPLADRRNSLGFVENTSLLLLLLPRSHPSRSSVLHFPESSPCCSYQSLLRRSFRPLSLARERTGNSLHRFAFDANYRRRENEGGEREREVDSLLIRTAQDYA